MTEKPIIMSAPMVRALLAGTKTQTRRVVKPQPEQHDGYWHWNHDSPTSLKRGFMGIWISEEDFLICLRAFCPYGQPGDRLWVRETLFWSDCDTDWCYQADNCQLWTNRPDGGYTAPILRKEKPAIPAIHMPREASRILLEVVSVRVERLQAISAHDALAEGVEYQYRNDCPPDERAITAYKELWASINGPDSWDTNPYVWCVDFKRLPPTTT